MCLLVIAWRVHPQHPLVLAGNRDEYHRRPAAPAHWWPAPEGILGGRDLEAGGAWLAVDRRGRLAVVTNVHEPVADPAGRRSRGELVVEALTDPGPVRGWISGLDGRRDRYGGFNLVVADGDALHCCSNRGPDRLDLEPGIYGLSNHLLDTPWPKVEAARRGLRALLDAGSLDVDSLFELLADRSPAPDQDLPATGVPLDRERALSPIFIAGDDYGTRASTVVLTSPGGEVFLEERRFGPSGVAAGSSSFGFAVSP
ncbi:MAG: NRDE family protein [Thermoanaerobaculales bacterium]|jgi:uncharacterized protein with NRDE domain|nr:NRDE family protein [Thermoanaerobaculales bacterium]